MIRWFDRKKILKMTSTVAKKLWRLSLKTEWNQQLFIEKTQKNEKTPRNFTFFLQGVVFCFMFILRTLKQLGTETNLDSIRWGIFNTKRDPPFTKQKDGNTILWGEEKGQPLHWYFFFGGFTLYEYYCTYFSEGGFKKKTKSLSLLTKLRKTHILSDFVLQEKKGNWTWIPVFVQQQGFFPNQHPAPHLSLRPLLRFESRLEMSKSIKTLAFDGATAAESQVSCGADTCRQRSMSDLKDKDLPRKKTFANMVPIYCWNKSCTSRIPSTHKHTTRPPRLLRIHGIMAHTGAASQKDQLADFTIPIPLDPV